MATARGRRATIAAIASVDFEEVTTSAHRHIMEASQPASTSAKRIREGMHDLSRAAQLSQELDRFVRIVSQEMNPERIIVFGSVATGEIQEWSDLDVVVVMQTELPFLERLRVILRRVQPKVTLDLFVYTPAEWAEIRKTRPFILDEIDAKGTVIYGRSTAAVG